MTSQSNTPLTDVTRLVAELAAPQMPRPVADTLPALAPRLAFEPELLLRAQDIKVVFFDVDGVMTDGGLFFTEAGETTKRFNALDGHGIKMLQRVGITPAVVTGRDSAPLQKRLAALGVTHVRYGTEDKRPAAESILADPGTDLAAGGRDGRRLARCPRAAQGGTGLRANRLRTLRFWAWPTMCPTPQPGMARCVPCAICCWWPPGSMSACGANSRLDHMPTSTAVLPLPTPRRSGHVLLRTLERMTVYVPVLLMGLLALASYWLLRSTPEAPVPVAKAAAQHIPTDIMRRFAVRTYRAGWDAQVGSVWERGPLVPGRWQHGD